MALTLVTICICAPLRALSCNVLTLPCLMPITCPCLRKV